VTTALGSRRDRANGAPQLIVRPVIVSERAARSGFYGTVRRWVITWPWPSPRPYRKCRFRCRPFWESAVVENVRSPSKEIFQIRHRRIIEFDDCGEELWMLVVPHDQRASVWLNFDAIELPRARSIRCLSRLSGAAARQQRRRAHM